MQKKVFVEDKSGAGNNAVIPYESLIKSKPVAKEINRPKPLWEILQEIYAVLQENKIPYHQEAIYFDRSAALDAGNEDNAVAVDLENLDAESIVNYTFDNLFTSIVITDDLNEMEGAIQLAYNEYGMQIAFGLTYEDRSRFVHLGEEEAIMSTYKCGDIKVLAYFVMVHKVRHWFPFGNKNVIEQLERSRSLMNKTLNKEFMMKFVDNFYQYTVKYNDCLDDNNLLRTNEFDHFIESLKANVDSWFTGNKNYSAWDLLSLGNALLKPENDIPLRTIIPLGFMWGGYMFSRLI
jgi:hypothetical protein